MCCQLKGTVFRRPAADDLSSQLRPYAANSIWLSHSDLRQTSTPNHSWQTCEHRHCPFPKLIVMHSLCLCSLTWREGTYSMPRCFIRTRYSLQCYNAIHAQPKYLLFRPNAITYASYLISIMLHPVLAVILTGLRPPTSLSRGPTSIPLCGCYVCSVLIYHERRSIFLM